MIAATLILGLFATAPARVLEPVMIGDELYTESFVAIADLEDGTYVKVQLGVSNAGSGDGNGACRIVIVQKDRSPVSKGKVYSRSDWRFDASPSPQLTMGSCKAIAQPNKTLAFEATVDDAKLTLTLDGSPDDMRAPVHSVKDGDNFYELEVLIPWAKAIAIYSVAGEAPHTVNGFGYADHSRANALPGKTAKSWVRFRALNKDRSRLVLVRFPPSGKPFVGWVWDQSQKSPANISRVQLQPAKGEGKAQSWRVMIDGEGGPWRITSGKLIQRDAPIEERGAMGSILGAVIGNPVTYTYRAVLEGKQDRASLSGILEVTLADE